MVEWWIALIVFQFVVITGVSLITLRQFISLRRTVWYATVFSCIGWALCFSIVLMLPLDIIDNDYKKKQDSDGKDRTIFPGQLLPIEWNILYWGTFVLSWLVFPFLQSYWLAGDFTKFEKFFTSFKENIYIYVIMGVVGGAGLVLLVVKNGLGGEQVRQLVVLLSNIYGLVVVVLLMGYGLVDIPRYLFRKADRSGWLKHYMIQAAVYKKEVEVTKEKLDDTMHKIRIVAQKVGHESQLRPFVDAILQKCPASYRDATGAVRGFSSADIDKDKVKYSYLVSLHRKVMDHDHAYTRALRLYEQIVSKALNLEDVLHSRNSIDRRVEWHFKAGRTGRFSRVKDVLEWYWQVYLYTWVFRLIGFLCACLSLVLVWCEVVMPTKDENLSPLSLIIRKIPLEGFPKIIYCVVILAYMAICTYTSLFKLQIWDYYRLVPHQQSDANSIMFSANYLCRLAAPLSFNFLLLTCQRDAAPAFSQVMGEMAGFFSLGEQFIYTFPCIVALYCLCSLLNVWSRVARSKFMKNLLTNCWPIKKLKIHIEDPRNLTDEGATLLRRERESREENNTGVSFDSVGDISDKKHGAKPAHTINKYPEDITTGLERGTSTLKNSRTLLRESATSTPTSAASAAAAISSGRPKFSFGDRKNRYTALRSDLP